MITGPLKAHAARSGCASIPLLLFFALIVVGVVLYTIPEAFGQATESGDWLTFGGILLCAAVLVVWTLIPGAATATDAVVTYTDALEYDRHTMEDDGLSHDNGKNGALWIYSDHGYNGRGPGVYKLAGGKYTKIRDFCPAEITERGLQNTGAFTGWNEANRQ